MLIVEDPEMKKVFDKRNDVAVEYCKKMGWPTDFSKLSFKQIIEIRKLPAWQDAVKELP